MNNAARMPAATPTMFPHPCIQSVTFGGSWLGGGVYREEVTIIAATAAAIAAKPAPHRSSTFFTRQGRYPIHGSSLRPTAPCRSRLRCACSAPAAGLEPSMLPISASGCLTRPCRDSCRRRRPLQCGSSRVPVPCPTEGQTGPNEGWTTLVLYVRDHSATTGPPDSIFTQVGLLRRPVLKTGEAFRVSVGSNPTPSALTTRKTLLTCGNAGCGTSMMDERVQLGLK